MRLRLGAECELRLRVHCAFSKQELGEFASEVLLPWLRRWGQGRESIPLPGQGGIRASEAPSELPAEATAAA